MNRFAQRRYITPRYVRRLRVTEFGKVKTTIRNSQCSSVSRPSEGPALFQGFGVACWSGELEPSNVDFTL